MKRHSLNPLSLVFGLLFTGLGLVFLVSDANLTDLSARWFWPLPAIALGLVIAATALTRELSDSGPDETRVASRARPEADPETAPDDAFPDHH